MTNGHELTLLRAAIGELTRSTGELDTRMGLQVIHRQVSRIMGLPVSQFKTDTPFLRLLKAVADELLVNVDRLTEGGKHTSKVTHARGVAAYMACKKLGMQRSEVCDLMRMNINTLHQMMRRWTPISFRYLKQVKRILNRFET